MRYFAMIGDGFPPSRPLALLRCRRPGLLESYRRDGRWHPDPRVELVTGEADRDLVELATYEVDQLTALWLTSAFQRGWHCDVWFEGGRPGELQGCGLPMVAVSGQDSHLVGAAP